MQTPSISYMRDYFAKAVELEKNIFVLREARNKANQEMEVIYQEKNHAEENKHRCGELLTQIDNKYLEEEKKLTDLINEDKINKPRFKRRSILFKVLLILLGCFAFFMFCIGLKLGDFETAQMMGMVFFLPCIPMFVLMLVSKGRSNRAGARLEKTTGRDLAIEKAEEEQSLTLSFNQSLEEIENLKRSESSLMEAQDRITQSYQMATAALKKLYGKNLVSSKYHNFNAMASFYEYLSTGRCLAVFGPDGVVDTYEDDIRIGIMIRTLSDIRDIVADTNEKTGYLCEQARIANQQLAQVNSSLSAIKVNTAVTAANTARIADYCSSINETTNRIYSSL